MAAYSCTCCTLSRHLSPVVPQLLAAWVHACSPHCCVLTGIKITDAARLRAAGISTELVAQRATEAYLIQMLRHGFFHADPHPGNLCVDKQGNLVFYDFGMMGQIVPDVRERLLDVFYGIYR